jgi:hypothetical protein
MIKTIRNTTRLCSLLVAFDLVLVLLPLNAAAQQARPADTGFSFAVYGDSRSLMHLPYKEDQEPEARQVMAEVFELVLPPDRAKALVKKYVKLTYDPGTHELTQMVMPFITMSEITTLTLDKGWVTKASVEDVKLLPGVHRTMYEISGGEWVARELVQDVISGRAKFILSTGDLVWSGA